MILAVIASLIGLAVIATALHKMTLNALPAFIGLSAGFFALDHGIGFASAVMVALGAGALAHGIFQGLAQPQLPRPLRLIARLIFAIPAGAAAWFMTFGLMTSSGGDHLTATIAASLAALFIAAQAWVSFEPDD